MTHTLHRKADTRAAKSEFLLISMAAKGINVQGSREKLVKILEICQAHGAVNLGDTQQNNIYFLGSPEELYKRMVDGAIAGALFDSKKNLLKALEKIKGEDTGMSIVVTGDTEEIKSICERIGVSSHTIALSLGIKGHTERLPSEDYLQMMTMCGHGMVTEHMIKAAADKIREGKTTVEKAVLQMTKCCVCGCFNPTRAKALLEEFI
jgi:hypothetical protein